MLDEGQWQWRFSLNPGQLRRGTLAAAAAAPYDAKDEGAIVMACSASTCYFGDGDAWQLEGGNRRRIPDQETFDAIYAQNGKRFYKYTAATIDRIPHGADVPSQKPAAPYDPDDEGKTVVACPGKRQCTFSDGDVWLLEGGKRHLIPDSETHELVMKARGGGFYSWPAALIERIPRGADMTSVRPTLEYWGRGNEPQRPPPERWQEPVRDSRSCAINNFGWVNITAPQSVRVLVGSYLDTYGNALEQIPAGQHHVILRDTRTGRVYDNFWLNLGACQTWQRKIDIQNW
ncbi:MAG: hypothetical protein HY332_16765 [Chloroflexi bacterium]|nr:hypothetical protein [Chloroflexota bacterium]